MPRVRGRVKTGKWVVSFHLFSTHGWQRRRNGAPSRLLRGYSACSRGGQCQHPKEVPALRGALRPRALQPGQVPKVVALARARGCRCHRAVSSKKKKVKQRNRAHVALQGCLMHRTGLWFLKPAVDLGWYCLNFQLGFQAKEQHCRVGWIFGVVLLVFCLGGFFF